MKGGSSIQDREAGGAMPIHRPREHFPQVLMNVLSLASTDPSIAKCIAWNADGTSFLILSRSGVEDVIIPQHFSGPNGASSSSAVKYASFTRKLNRWGFRRIATKIPESASFYHPHFRRDAPDLISLMECAKESRKNMTASIASDAAEAAAVAAGHHHSALNSIHPGIPYSMHRSPLPGPASRAAYIGGNGPIPAGGHLLPQHVPARTILACPSQAAIEQHRGSLAAAKTHWGALRMSGSAPPLFGEMDYLANLEIMALARRERALAKFREAANEQLNLPSEQEEGEKKAGPI